MKKDIFDLKNRLSLFVLFLVLVLTTSCSKQEIKFYKAEEVFNEFNMTSEYHKDIEEYKRAFDSKVINLTTQLDSLKRDFKVEADEKNKQLLYYKIADFKKSLEKVIEKGELVLMQKVEQGDEEIWARINLYLADYCKEQKIHLLIDVGNVITTPYYDKAHDLTKDCSNYINKKYNEVLK